MSNILSCERLVKTYTEGKLKTEVLKGVDFNIQSGQMVAIIGQSGSGKSTLMHCLGGVDKPSSGEVYLNGRRFSKCTPNKRAKLRNQYLGFVYQFHHLLPEFTALDNVALPLMLQKLKKKEVISRATNILERVGLKQRLKHKPSELSGGERQRVALARSLVTEPACMLADEPTGNLDAVTAAEMFDLIQSIRHDLQTAFILVTHDLELASKTDQVFNLVGGKLS